MEHPKNYIIIQPQDFPFKEYLFPFHIYFYDEENKLYKKFLYANTPFNKETQKEFKENLMKGYQVAVPLNQQKTFFKFTGKVVEVREIKEEKEVYKVSRAELRNLHFGLLEHKKELKKAMENDDFTEIIRTTRNVILQFPLNLSNDVSIAVMLTNDLPSFDSFYNRTMVLSYFFALYVKLQDTAEISKLIASSYLHHVGYTQLPTFFSLKQNFSLTDNQMHEMKKHTKLTAHLVKKVGLVMSPDIEKIILEHHERANGAGYPEGKTEHQLHPLSLLLAMSSHALEFSSGRIDGKKHQLFNVLKSIKEKNSLPGLDFNFGKLAEKAIEEFVLQFEKEDS